MSNGKNWEPALNPEDLGKFFVLRANEGDVDGLVALYEADAVLAIGDRQLAIGSAAIRAFYAKMLTDRPQFEPGEQRTALRYGDLALTSSRLLNGVVTAEIARKQPNGTWLWAVDQPTIAKEDSVVG